MNTFTETLRLIDDAKLDVYQYRMLMHIWRVGLCWEKLRTTAAKCHMSLGKASEVRSWLIAEGWIAWVTTDDGRLALALCSSGEHSSSGCSASEQIGSPDEQRSSPRERHLKNTSSNEPLEGEGQRRDSADSVLLAWLSENGVARPKSADEWQRLRHRATLVWLQATSYWPSYANLAYLIGELGEEADEATLARAWQFWRASGNRPANIVGVIDWYKEMLADSDWTPKARLSPRKNGKKQAKLADIKPVVVFEEPYST